jgi:hypothetical protein
MQFPGVTAVWVTVHKAGPRDGIPPLVRDMHEIHLKFERAADFSIDKVGLTRWDAYWAEYSFLFRANHEGGVTANKVDTKGLAKITVLTSDDCATMRAGFGRCSELLHSSSETLNKPLPGPQVIKAEIDALESWIASVKQRQANVAS